MLVRLLHQPTFLSRKSAFGLAIIAALVCSPALAEPIYRGQIALTFDDAPTGDGTLMSGEERTAMLIEGLEQADVSEAMFFVLTGNIQGASDARRLRAYTQAGHVLANHTHSHPWLRDTATDFYLQDLDRAADILSQYESVVPFFRFPYLDEGNARAMRLAVQAGLRERGLQNGYVTVDTYDWYMQAMVNEAVGAGHEIDMDRLGQVYVDILQQGIDFYDAIARVQLGRSPRHVLLLHENDLAALFLPDLVASLREQGWDIITAQEAFDDPIAQIQPETQFNGQGRVAAIAHAQGVSPRNLVSPMEEEDLLRAIFLQNGLLPSPILPSPSTNQ